MNAPRPQVPYDLDGPHDLAWPERDLWDSILLWIGRAMGAAVLLSVSLLALIGAGALGRHFGIL